MKNNYSINHSDILLDNYTLNDTCFNLWIYEGPLKPLEIFNDESISELRNINEVYCISDDSSTVSYINNFNIKPNQVTYMNDTDTKGQSMSLTAGTSGNENVNDHFSVNNQKQSEPVRQNLDHSSEANESEPDNTPLMFDNNITAKNTSDKQNFKLGVWNISGLKSKLNGNVEFNTFIDRFDIIGFVETWADENDIFELNGFGEPSKANREKHPNAWKNSGGIAVFIKQTLSQFFHITRLASLSDTRNLIWLKFDLNTVLRGAPFICGFTYLSPENSSVHAEEDLFQIIEEDIALFRLNYSDHCVVLAGDFNAYTENDPDIYTKRPIF